MHDGDEVKIRADGFASLMDAIGASNRFLMGLKMTDREYVIQLEKEKKKDECNCGGKYSDKNLA